MDKSTRALFVDFTTYNAAENVHFFSRIVFELPAGGGLRSNANFIAMKARRPARARACRGLTGDTRRRTATRAPTAARCWPSRFW